MAFQIKRAERKQARARIGLCGPSGSGKTMSALRMAGGLVEYIAAQTGSLPTDPIGVIDTERKSASLYADVAPFVVIDLEPPYSAERYVEALDALERHGCVAIIIDQMSHAWAGPGGMLEWVDTLKDKAKNQFAAWKTVTPEQNRFVDRILRSEAHIFACMRAKTEWVLEERNGAKVPRKVGLAPIQRDGIEYEFTTMFDLSPDGNTATTSKDRTRIFQNRSARIDEAAGAELGRWLYSGGPEQAAAEEQAQQKAMELLKAQDPPEGGFERDDDQGPLITKPQQRKFWAACAERAKQTNFTKEHIGRSVLSGLGYDHTDLIPKAEFEFALKAVELFQDTGAVATA